MNSNLTSDFNIPSTYKLVRVDTDTEQTMDLNLWELIDRKYEMGKFFLLFQHIDKDVVERLINESIEDDDFHNEPGGVLYEQQKVGALDEEQQNGVVPEQHVEARNAWEDEE